MHPLIKKAVTEFNLQKYFEAHEFFEDFWNAQYDGRDKTLTQGLVQITAALLLLRDGRKDGAMKVWERAKKNLVDAYDGFQNIKLNKLKRETQLFLMQAQKTGQMPSMRQVPRIQLMEQ